MIEIAIAALKACEPEIPDVDRSVDDFEVKSEENLDIKAQIDSDIEKILKETDNG